MLIFKPALRLREVEGGHAEVPRQPLVGGVAVRAPELRRVAVRGLRLPSVHRHSAADALHHRRLRCCCRRCCCRRCCCLRRCLRCGGGCRAHGRLLLGRRRAAFPGEATASVCVYIHRRPRTICTIYLIIHIVRYRSIGHRRRICTEI